MHVFSHQFHITWENTAKPIEWGKPEKFVPGNIIQNPSYVENLGNWYSYFSHSMGAFFHQIPILWYTSSYGKYMGFFIKFQKALEKPAKPIELGRPGKLAPVIFP